LQVEGVSDATIAELTLDVAGPLQDERVVPVRGVGVTLAQGVINQQRFAEVAGQADRHVERRVFVPPHGVVHPVEDEFAIATLGTSPGFRSRRKGTHPAYPFGEVIGEWF
jgi:hypothetical protein